MKRLLCLFVIAFVLVVPALPAGAEKEPLNQDPNSPGNPGGIVCYSPECAVMGVDRKTGLEGCTYDYQNGGCACIQGSPAGKCSTTGQ